MNTITDPIFIFSTGMRTGSTLIQRILNSIDHVMIWGEPVYFNICVLSNLYTNSKNMKHSNLTSFINKGVRSFSPNILPLPIKIIQESRIFLNRLYTIPITNVKPIIKRWGGKFIKSDILTYEFIKLLYPNSRFIFLTRHPKDIYRSLCKVGYNFQKNFDCFWKPTVLQFKDFIGNKDWFFIKYEEISSRIYHCLNFLKIKHNRSDIQNILDFRIGYGSKVYQEDYSFINNYFNNKENKNLSKALGYEI